jgi:hypothetical protein
MKVLQGRHSCSLVRGQHYEKSHPLKPHYPATKTQKNSYIIILQLSLSITTSVQLSP